MINNFLNIKLWTGCGEVNEGKGRVMKGVLKVMGSCVVMGLMIEGVAMMRKRFPSMLIIKKSKMGEVGKWYKGGFMKKMTKHEACLILNVLGSVSGKELREAHKRLMVLNHPDNGGSTYIASKINQAKEILGMHIKQYKH